MIKEILIFILAFIGYREDKSKEPYPCAYCDLAPMGESCVDCKVYQEAKK